NLPHVPWRSTAVQPATAPREAQTAAQLLFLVQRFSLRPLRFPPAAFLQQSLCVCVALLELVPIHVPWAALPAPVVGVEHPCEVQLAAAVSPPSAGQALR